MALTVELPDDVLRRLLATAAACGISVEQLAAETLAQLPAESAPIEPEPAAGATLAFLAAGASAEGISHRIDALLADGFGRD